MKTTQAWGWLTAGVLALGVNGFYQDGGAAWAHRIADQVAHRSANLIQDASEQVGQVAELTNLVGARSETASCRMATAAARFQTNLVRTRSVGPRLEQLSVREEVAMGRLEARRGRMEARLARMHAIPAELAIDCPRIRVRIPGVHIETVSAETE
jgi:hypothetical protein